MRILVALIQFAALTLANPISLSLLPRTHVCQNAPSTIAGTTPRARSAANPIFWCAGYTSTYITFALLDPIGDRGLSDMINEAYSYIIGHINLEGDSMVPNGVFAWRAYGFSLGTTNANNHQTTWGVLGAALFALMDYMGKYGYATVRFDVFDGAHQVGSGWLE